MWPQRELMKWRMLSLRSSIPNIAELYSNPPSRSLYKRKRNLWVQRPSARCLRSSKSHAKSSEQGRLLRNSLVHSWMRSLCPCYSFLRLSMSSGLTIPLNMSECKWITPFQTTSSIRPWISSASSAQSRLHAKRKFHSTWPPSCKSLSPIWINVHKLLTLEWRKQFSTH